MNRRGMLGAICGALSLPKILKAGDQSKTLQGVGVVRFPEEHLDGPSGRMYARDHAKALAESIRPGTVIAMPNRTDSFGNFVWDFRIEGGDPGQVRIERHEESAG